MGKRVDVFGVEVTGDITGLKKAMDDASRVARSAERSLKNINKALQLDPSNENLIEKQKNAYRQTIEEYKKYLNTLYGLRKRLENNPNSTDQTFLKEQATALDLEIQKVRKSVKELEDGFKNIKGAEFEKVKLKIEKLFESMNNFKKILDNIKTSLSGIDKKIELDPGNIDLYIEKHRLLEDAIRVTTAQLKDYETRLESLRNSKGYLQGFQESQKEFIELSAHIEQTRADLENFKKQASVSPEMDRFSTQMANLSDTFMRLSENTRYLSRMFQGLMASSFNSYKSMESDVANIKRVVKDLRDSTVQDLKDIAVQTGTTFSEVSEYATIAGALGLAEDEISKFSKAMIDLNTATGGVFSGEEGAKGIAVFLKQLNLGIDQAENFGSAIAVIGDKYADIGDETVNVATKITGLNSIIKTNQYELIGLAGVMADLGLAGDTNANAINRAFLQIDKVIGGGVKKAEEKLGTLARTAGMTSQEFKRAWGENAMDAFLRFTDGLKSSIFNEVNDAISSSSKKVEEFASVLGMSAEQFKNAWSADSKGMLDKYIEALGELGEEGIVASQVLSDLGISSVNTAQTLLRLSGSGNEVRNAIELTTRAWQENTALSEKSGLIYETTERKLQGLFEALKQLGGSLIDEFAPTIKEVIEELTKLVKATNNLNPNIKKLATYFMAFGASVSPVSKALGKITDGFKKNDDGITKYAEGLEKLRNIIMSPVGLVGALTALGVAFTVAGVDDYNRRMEELYGNTNRITENFNSLRKSVSETTQEFQFEQSILESRADTIDELLQKVVELDEAEKDSYETKREIKSIIDELNASLGDSKFYYDESKNAIVDEKGEVVDLMELYPQLAQERRKSYYLDEYQSLYKQALEDEKSLMLERIEQEYKFQQYLKETDKVTQEYFENIKNMTSAEAISYINSIKEENHALGTALDELYWHYVEVEQAKAKIDAQTVSVMEFIKTIDELGQAEGEQIDILIARLEQQQRHLDENNMSLQEMKDLVAKYYEILNDPENYHYTEEMRVWFEEEIAHYEQQIQLIEDATKRTKERYDDEAKLMEQYNANVSKLFYGEDGVVAKHKRASAESMKYWDDGFSASSQKLVSEFASGMEQARAIASQGIDVPVRLSWSGGWGGLNDLTLNTHHFQSGGYNHLTRLMDKSLMSGGYSVRNFNGGGFKVYNSFVIQNGQNVTTDVLKGWALQIVDVINTELGNAI